MNVAKGVQALIFAQGATPGLSAVLEAVTGQSLPPEQIAVVDVRGNQGAKAPVVDLPAGIDVITVHATTFGAALNDALTSAAAQTTTGLHGPKRWWILHDDSIPEPDCLDHLWNAADQSRNIGALGPKQLSPDGTQLRELGILAASDARRLERTIPGEIDQGQYDSASDVLAVGTAGMLLDAQAYADAGPFDSFLGPFGEGLDYGRRLHLSGYRVVVVPQARLLHHQRSYVAKGSFRRRRTAQLYNWLLATSWWTLLPLMVWLALLCPARALWRLATGSGRRAVDEVAAWLALVPATPHLLKSRVRNGRRARVPASSLKSLEISAKDLKDQRRRRREAGNVAIIDKLDDVARRSFIAYRRQSRAALISVIVVTVAAAALGIATTGATAMGPAWAGVPVRFADLWEAAWAAWLPAGDGHALPADPLTILMALLAAPGAALGADPATVSIYLLWLATPASAVAAWAMASAFSTSNGMRVATALLWAGLPTLAFAQFSGALGPALAHVALPALVAAWMRINNSYQPQRVAGADSVTVIEPVRRHGALAVVAIAAIVLSAVQVLTFALLLAAALWSIIRGARRSWRVLVSLLPAAILIAPTLFAALTTPGAWRALLAVGGGAMGVPTPGMLLALGVPTSIEWTPMLWVSIAVASCAGLWILSHVVTAPATASMSRLATWTLVAAPLFFAGAWGLQALPVVIKESGPVVTWPGVLLSCGFVALIVAAHACARNDLPVLHPTKKVVTLTQTLIIVAASVGVAIAPVALSFAPTTASVEIPAVTAQGQASDRSGRLLVLTQGSNADLDVQLWRGDASLLTASSTVSRAHELHQAMTNQWDEATLELARLALTLTVHPDLATVQALAAHGVDTILVPAGQNMPGRIDALSRAPGLEKVGSGDTGHLWRVRPGGVQPARVTLDADGATSALPSTQMTTRTQIPTGGTVTLAERADSGWHATLNGQPLEAVNTGGWQQTFDAPEGGELVVAHSRSWLYPWWIASGIALAWTVIVALPFRRKTP